MNQIYEKYIMNIIGILFSTFGILWFLIGMSESASVEDLEGNHPIWSRLVYRRQINDEKEMSTRKKISGAIFFFVGLCLIVIF